MKRFKLRTILLAFAAAGAAAAAQPASALIALLRTQSYVPVTLVRGQNGRVNVVNLANAPEPGSRQFPPGPCKGRVQFFDARGEALGDAQDFELGPGQATSIAALVPAVMPVTDAAGDGSVRHLRAVVLLPAVQTAKGQSDACSAIGTAFEVYRTDTQETQFIGVDAGTIRGLDGPGN